MDETSRTAQCGIEIETRRHSQEEMPHVVQRLVLSCQGEKGSDHIGPDPIPSRDAVIEPSSGRIFRILYPGYFMRTRLRRVQPELLLGQKTTTLFEVLSEQFTVALRHHCIRHNLPCLDCEDRGLEITVELLNKLPTCGPCCHGCSRRL